MPNLSIKDVPEAWAEILRQRAAANHRSLQGELMAIIEQAIARPRLAAEPQPPSAPVQRAGHRRPGVKPIEQWLSELQTLVPAAPGAKQLSSVALIRADRDRRSA
jgi:plasmid stability protein